MIFSDTPFKGVFLIDPEPFRDSRGWFARTYCKKEFAAIGHTRDWVQINHSYTENKGTIRGMHFQLPPFGEIKLIRCIAGAVDDVIVDIRKDSETFLQWMKVELTADNKRMIYIPEGFAHGFQTVVDGSELIYHHSAYYDPKAEAGLRYDDPLINIRWTLPVTEISDRDRAHPFLEKKFNGI